MRRKDKQIKDKETIQWILKEALFCRIALCHHHKPYLLPMNFGFKDNSLYLHSAPEGKKIDILKENPNLCFQMDIKKELVPSKKACDWGVRYYSVVGSGKACFIHDQEEKRQALDVIMAKYSWDDFQYSRDDLKKVTLIKVKITELTAKKSGY
jgi:uncharacterized protein